jgi:hypothetical protein
VVGQLPRPNERSYYSTLPYMGMIRRQRKKKATRVVGWISCILWLEEEQGGRAHHHRSIGWSRLRHLVQLGSSGCCMRVEWLQVSREPSAKKFRPFWMCGKKFPLTRPHDTSCYVCISFRVHGPKAGMKPAQSLPMSWTERGTVSSL